MSSPRHAGSLAALTICLLLLAPATSWAGPAEPNRGDRAPSAGSSATPEPFESADHSDRFEGPQASAPIPVPQPTEEALRYYRTGNAWWLFNLAWGLLIPALILLSGTSVALRNQASRLTGDRWYPTLLLYFLGYALITSVVDLPFAYLQGFARPHAYGLSNQLISKWIVDMLKGFGLGLIAAGLFLWIPYLLLRRSPRRWWLYTALASVPFFLFVLLVSPLWVAPLFNDFGPMEDQALEARILALSDRADVTFDRVFEVNKSVDTQQVNAYVTGFSGSKRIVLWDTLLEKLDDDQVVFVMGHELGHYVLGHLMRSLALFSIVAFFSLYAVHRAANWILERTGPRFGIRQLSDPAALPLLLILIHLVSLVLAPASLAYSRYQEHEADRFALEITQDNHAGASAFVALQTHNLSVPYPGTLYKWMRAGHPLLGERIEFCNRYRPWKTRQPLRYGDRFQPQHGASSP